MSEKIHDRGRLGARRKMILLFSNIPKSDVEVATFGKILSAISRP
jgi:hypothetical protein